MVVWFARLTNPHKSTWCQYDKIAIFAKKIVDSVYEPIPMKFQFAAGEPEFIKLFTAARGSQCAEYRITIPKPYGEGYILIQQLEPGLELLLFNMRLTNDMIVKCLPPMRGKKKVIIRYSLSGPPDRSPFSRFSATGDVVPSLHIIPGDISCDNFYPSGCNIIIVIIEIRITFLSKVLKRHMKIELLENILSGRQPFTFEGSEDNDLRLIQQLFDKRPSGPLDKVFYLSKVYELIHVIFSGMFDSADENLSRVKTVDREKIDQVKQTILTDLSTPPRLSELAGMVHLSESKMRRLFTLVHGKSLYRYYEQERMKEAAKLIRTGEYTITEVGYKMGFSNLSHFSRLFAKYIGTKPKKYEQIFLAHTSENRNTVQRTKRPI